MIVELTPAESAAHVPALTGLYCAAFGADTAAGDSFEESLRRCVAEYDGARVVLVRTEDRTVGFAYGFTFELGHWWPDQVGPELQQAGLGVWTADAFELVELVVAPAYQGRGHGSRLLRSVLTTARERRVLLATAPDNPARRLYARHGLRELLPDFTYPATGAPAVVLGLDRYADLPGAQHAGQYRK